MKEVPFSELINIKSDHIIDIKELQRYMEGALMAREAILDLLLKINSDNYSSDGEHINESCRLDAEALENAMHLIKYSQLYEVE